MEREKENKKRKSMRYLVNLPYISVSLKIKLSDYKGEKAWQFSKYLDTL